MDKKKLITFLLALTMILSLSVGASAAETTEAKVPVIAALYHTSSNNVGAWISRAAKKLRSDPDFLDTFDIAC